MTNLLYQLTVWIHIAKESTQAENISVLSRKDSFLSSWGGIFNFLWSVWSPSLLLLFGFLSHLWGVGTLFAATDVHLIFPPHRNASLSSFVVYRPSSSLTCHTLLFLALYFSISQNCSALIVCCLSSCPNFNSLFYCPASLNANPFVLYLFIWKCLCTDSMF